MMHVQVYKDVLNMYKLYSGNKAFRRSLTYSRNRVGPRADPWGTPDFTGVNSDLT